MNKYFVSDMRIILSKTRFLLGEAHVLRQYSLKIGACVDDFVSSITYTTCITSLPHITEMYTSQAADELLIHAVFLGFLRQRLDVSRSELLILIG